MTNTFPRDFIHTLTGFGGDSNMNKEEHRKNIKKTPVVLVHGNAAHVTHPMFGWDTMKRFLKEEGYQNCEIWAMDYLGENNFRADMPTPVRNHIDDVRKFIDDARDYLGVQRVDIICHSLGGMVTAAYIRGFKSDGTWDNSDNRLDNIGTAVFLATANHGLGIDSVGEFQTGSSFEINSHIFKEIKDDTPGGIDDPKKMIVPEESRTCQSESGENRGNPGMVAEMAALEERWKVRTDLDVPTLPPQNVYVAITAKDDFVDKQNPDTGRLEGAHCNLRFNLGPNILGHSQILKQKGVFDAFKGCLNKYPPSPPSAPVSAAGRLAVSPVSIRVSENTPRAFSGTGESYPKPLSVTINVAPTDMDISYSAKRVTKEYQAGYIMENIIEACKGKLRDGETLTLSSSGVWEVTFSGAGASDIKRTYGVAVTKPTVEIVTPDVPRFTESLVVKATASSGRLYYSFDGMHFNEGDRVKISETNTVYFVAIDNDNASEIVYRFYEKELGE